MLSNETLIGEGKNTFQGKSIDGRMRYFEVSDLYEFMMSNPTEKL